MGFWDWVKTGAKSTWEYTKYCFAPGIWKARKEKENTEAIISSNAALAERREEMQIAQLKLQHIQEIEKQKSQANLSRELQEFVQQVEEARLQKNLDFQRWRLEQERTLQLELVKLNQELQRELAIYQRQTSLKALEEQKRLDNSPIWLVASDILTSQVEEIVPLHIFLAPPKIQFDRLPTAVDKVQDFPELELSLAEGLRQFWRSYLAQNRPVDFIGGAWVSKSYHSEASVKALFGVLKSDPVLILESEIDGNYLNFRIGYWGLNWGKCRYDSVISKFPYWEALSEFARSRARQWSETKKKLIAAGEPEAEVDQLAGDNRENLKTLELEERCKKAGVDTNLRSYVVNKKDFEELGEILIIYHCLFAGLIADEYFLSEYSLPPLLPQLLPGLTQKISDAEALSEMIGAVVGWYERLYQGLESELPALIPELSLDLAWSLAHLPDRSWSRRLLDYSVKSWLKLRGVTPSEGTSPLKAMKPFLREEDGDYVGKLREFLSEVKPDSQGYGLKLLKEKIAYWLWSSGVGENAQINWMAAERIVWDASVCEILYSCVSDNFENQEEAVLSLAQRLSGICEKKLRLAPAPSKAYVKLARSLLMGDRGVLLSVVSRKQLLDVYCDHIGKAAYGLHLVPVNCQDFEHWFIANKFAESLAEKSLKDRTPVHLVLSDTKWCLDVLRKAIASHVKEGEAASLTAGKVLRESLFVDNTIEMARLLLRL